MTEASKYAMIIQWSDEDQSYVVSFPEWSDLLHTHGETYEAAAQSGREVLEMVVASRLERGEPLPTPRVFAASA